MTKSLAKAGVILSAVLCFALIQGAIFTEGPTVRWVIEAYIFGAIALFGGLKVWTK